MLRQTLYFLCSYNPKFNQSIHLNSTAQFYIETKLICYNFPLKAKYLNLELKLKSDVLAAELTIANQLLKLYLMNF
ncbi:hypothetical protein BpHYR1_052331 [Brachionus plicatilis]|uniref:Uncharacterized protein n=1 Tax=Brachionus plicatilis TaxID=10195 RepID=A0A3M7T3E3_BRAPC|nr:hypothetical protein BpHYR1_052331 [Brachionus plicatilis]